MMSPENNAPTAYEVFLLEGDLYKKINEVIKRPGIVFGINLGEGSVTKEHMALRTLTVDQIASASLVKIDTGVFGRDTATASGKQSITGLGFTPTHISFVMLHDGDDVMSWGIDDGSLTEVMLMKTAGGIGDEHTASIAYKDDVGSTSYYGKIDSWDADGFTIAWTRTGAAAGVIGIFYTAYRQQA